MTDRGPDALVRCARGHVNAATANNCRLCGLPLPGRGRRPPGPPEPTGRHWWQRLLAFLRRSWLVVAVMATAMIIVVWVLLAVRHGTSRQPVPAPSPTGSRSPSASPSPSVSAPPPLPSPSQGIGPGDSGPEVLLLQQRLRALGYPVVPDGQFGSRTSNAVIDFKRHHGLPPNAVVDPQTQQTLQRATQRATSSATPSS